MTQKERELIGERTQAALAAAKARGRVLGEDGSYRPARAPGALAATQACREAAERAAHRLVLEVQQLRSKGVVRRAAGARALTQLGVPSPRGGSSWTHTTVTRVLARIST